MSKSTPALDPAIERKLINAIEKWDAAAVARLVANGIDVNAPLKHEHNRLPLALATQYGANDVAVVLFKAGADWRKGGLNLVWSVYFRDEWLTRKLIEAGADVNYRGRIMGRPLPLATRNNLPNLVSLLIQAGADVNADCPLAQAVSANYTEPALLLLKAGAVVPKDKQLLPWAAQHGNHEVLRALIKAGGALNEHATLTEFDIRSGKHVSLCEHATALIIAAARDAVGMVQDLIEAGADLYATDATGITALELARRHQHPEVIALLETATAKQPRKADPGADLIFAAEKGDSALVKQLLAAGADPNQRDSRPRSKGFTPLMLAARAGCRETVLALLDGGANLALKDDADPGSDSGFNFLLSEGGFEDLLEAGFSMYRTVLHWAAEKGNAEIIRLLIERGADVNAPDRAKLTPLHMAAGIGALETVRHLLKAGADPNVRARDQQTPLHNACRGGNLEIAQALLAAGARLELKNEEGNTPLLVAAGHAYPTVVAALLAAGADVHAANRMLETALGKAAGPGLFERKYYKGDIIVRFLRPEPEILETIRLLLAAGADPARKDKHDFSPLDWAKRGLKESKFYTRVVELLQQARPQTRPARAAVRPSSPTPRAVSVAAKQPAKAKKPAAPAKAKAATPGDEPAAPPDFSRAARRPEFLAVLSELEQLCGTKPHPMDGVDGGHTFHVQSGQPFDLDKVHSDFLKHGCHVFSLESTFDNWIGVLPTADKYQVLLAMQTNGQNYDLSPQDIVVWLRKLEEDQPFILTGARFDFLSGRFTTRVARPAALAKRMYEFCPDIVDQGCGDVQTLAAELRKSQTFFFWWD